MSGFPRVAGAVQWLRDVVSFEDRFGKSRGISYPRSLLLDKLCVQWLNSNPLWCVGAGLPYLL